jgi:hypothetical protein
MKVAKDGRNEFGEYEELCREMRRMEVSFLLVPLGGCLFSFLDGIDFAARSRQNAGPGHRAEDT